MKTLESYAVSRLREEVRAALGRDGLAGYTDAQIVAAINEFEATYAALGIAQASVPLVIAQLMGGEKIASESR